MTTPRPSRTQAGMTLIEVLVAILIFSFGLLGFVGLQARAIQYSTSAEDSNRAAMLANEIASTMVTKGTISLGSADITAWQTRVGDPTTVGLPNGTGTIAASGVVATITVTWRPVSAASGSVNAQNQYVTQVVLP